MENKERIFHKMSTTDFFTGQDAKGQNDIMKILSVTYPKEWAVFKLSGEEDLRNFFQGVDILFTDKDRENEGHHYFRAIANISIIAIRRERKKNGHPKKITANFPIKDGIIDITNFRRKMDVILAKIKDDQDIIWVRNNWGV